MTLTYHETAEDTVRGETGHKLLRFLEKVPETVQIPEPFSYGVDTSQFKLYPPKQPW